MNYLFQKQLSPVESTGLNFGGKSTPEYDSQYSLVLKDLSYNGKATKGEPLTVSEFEGNFAFIADQARQNKAAVDELSFTVNNLGSATNTVKMIGKLTGADLNIDNKSFPYINVNIIDVVGYGDTVNFISGETLSIYFPVSDVTAQVRLVEVRDALGGNDYTEYVKALVWENLPDQLVAFPEEDMSNVTITGLDSGIVVPFVSMGDYEPSTIQTITFDESGVYVITDILMTNASTTIETAENGMFLSIHPDSKATDATDAAAGATSERTKLGVSEEDMIIAITNDENGSSLQMLSNSNNFINTMVGAGNGSRNLGGGSALQTGVSTSTTGGIQLFGNTLVSNEMYFLLGTSEGSAATCDIYVFGYKISDVSNSFNDGKGMAKESAQAKTGA
jgi:hypothetical protein